MRTLNQMIARSRLRCKYSTLPQSIIILISCLVDFPRYTKATEDLCESNDDNCKEGIPISKGTQTEDLDIDDIEGLSDKDEDIDQYTSSSCRQTLAKVG